VNEEYDKLMTEHKIYEKKLNSILIKVIIVKQEMQQKKFKDIHEILKTIPGNNKNQTLVQIEKIVQNLLERSVLDVSVPRIYSELLSDPPVVKDPAKDQKGGQDCRAQQKQIVKKIYKSGIEMTNYMEPKISNFYHAKNLLEADGNGDFILNIINWAAPEMMKTNATYTEECETFSFVMLLWELAFQKIPYEKMTKEEIIVHVTQNRRETQEQPFYSLDFLHAQRKYLRIIKEGWCGKPEKRINLDEILLRLSEIDAELIKNKENKLAQSFGKFERPSDTFKILEADHLLKILEVDILNESIESDYQR
ncbi:701_t:CDS:2, partial [Racocetra persica]